MPSPLQSPLEHTHTQKRKSISKLARIETNQQNFFCNTNK